MGQEGSKPSQGVIRGAATDAPGSGVGGDAAVDAQSSARNSSVGAVGGGVTAPPPNASSSDLDAELARMLHFYNPSGADPTRVPRHVTSSKAVMDAYHALPRPRPAIMRWSTQAVVLNRHDKLVADAFAAPWTIYAPRPAEAAVDAVPNPAALHRVFAAWETLDMQASQAALATQQKMGEALKQLAFDAQLAKSTAMQQASALNRAAALMQAADAELSSSGSNIDAVVALVSSVSTLASEIDAMLTDEDRVAVSALMRDGRAETAGASSGSNRGSKSSFFLRR